MNKKIVRNTLTGVAAAVLLVGCGAPDEDAMPAGTASAAPLRTTVATVGEKAFSLRLRADATLTLKVGTVPVVGEIGGMLVGDMARVGQSVARGDVLAQIDTRDLRNRYVQARAERERVAVQLTEARETLDEHLALAEQDFISRNTLRSTRVAAEALEHALENAKAAESIAERAVNEARLLAPIDGVIARRTLTPGEYAAPGSTVFEIVPARVAAQDLEMAITLPEHAWQAIDVGARVTLEGADDYGRTFETIVRRKQPALDANHRFSVFADAPPSAAIPGKMVSVIVEGQPRAHLAVPESSLVLQGREQVVFIVAEDGQVRRVPVTRLEAGSSPGGWTAIEGVHAGDLVAVSGASFLKEGATVAIAP